MHYWSRLYKFLGLLCLKNRSKTRQCKSLSPNLLFSSGKPITTLFASKVRSYTLGIRSLFESDQILSKTKIKLDVSNNKEVQTPNEAILARE